MFASITRREVQQVMKGFIDVEFWNCDVDQDEDDNDVLLSESGEEDDQECKNANYLPASTG